MLEGSLATSFDTGAQQSVSSQAAGPRRTRKIAILGFGSTVRDCPWRDPSWELWGLNGFWRVGKDTFGIDVPEARFTCWFDMHGLDYIRHYGELAGIAGSQEKWLSEPHPFPIFMLEARPDHPSVERFPIESLIQLEGRDYFTSGVAYALVFALAQPDVAEIGLWGIDLVHKTEYQQQRPCAEYWIGRAEERGIKITIHDNSALLKQRHRYGYNQADPLSAEMKKKLIAQADGLHEAMKKNQAEVERLTAQLHTDDGALQTIRGLLESLEIWDRGGNG